MISTLCRCLLLSILFYNTEAIQASPHSFRHRQPDGSLSLRLYINGNHKFNIVTDENGFTVVDDEQEGWKVYASLNETSGHLQPTKLKVGFHNPFKAVEAGIIRGKMETPNLEVLWKLCGKFCSHQRENGGIVRRLRNTTHSNIEQRSVHEIQSIGNTTLAENNKWHRQNLRQRIPDVRPRRKAISKKVSVTKGTIKNLIILIRFSDHDTRVLPTKQEIWEIMNQMGGNKNAPTGSVRDYYSQSSYGVLNVISDVIDWFRLPETEAYYADNSSGATTKFEEAIRLALENLEKMDPYFSFKDYDKDGDGIVDAVMILHSGYGAEWGKDDCYKKAATDRIWAHKWAIEGGWYSTSKYKVSLYHTSSALWGTCGKEISRIGTLAHEIGHRLGLPDLYSGGSGIGSFGLMGNSWGFDGSQRYPPIMCAWSKMQLGWLEPKEIKASGVYEIEASAVEPEAYIIKTRFPLEEYILIENRQQLGFDAKIPQGGLAVWHIDGAVSFENPPGYPGQVNFPKNNNHYHVALLQADGRYDLERGENRGDGSDLWHNKSFRKSLGSSSPQLGIHPNTNSYQRGFVKSTGIEISEFSASGSKMSFRVKLPIGKDNNVPVTAGSLDADTSISDDTDVLFTTMDGGKNGYGIMFEVRSTSVYSIIVQSLSFHTSSTNSNLQVEVFTKKGSHLDSKESSWTTVADTTVHGMGYLKVTDISQENFEDIRILSGERQSFFIMLEYADMKYSIVPSSEFQTPYVSNGDLEILTGSGVGKGKFEQVFPNRVFNGLVKYRTEKASNPGSNIVKTTYEHNNSGYGSMFDVTAFTSLTITSMDIHTSLTGSVPVEIWTKNGGYASSKYSPMAWAKLIRIEVQGKGNGKPTVIPIQAFPRVQIKEGETRAFYVTLRSNDLSYTNGKYPVANQHLQILPGAGVGSYAFGQSFYPRTWNGALHYSVNEVDTNAVEQLDSSGTLLTTYEGGNRSYGCQFDVIVNKAIMITSLEIHTKATKEIWVEVFTRKGSHHGYETKRKDWSQPIFQRKVVGKGISNRTPLPREYFSPIHILKGEIQAFYVTLRNPDMIYTNGQSLGRTYVTNEEFSILEGTGIGAYKFNRLVSPRIFNGVIHYEAISSRSSPTFQLRTAMRGETGAFGNMFDVTVKRDLDIVSMSFHTDSTESVLVEVWTRQGSYVGHEQDLEGWSRVARGFVEGSGRGAATAIPEEIFTTVEIPTYATQAFYMTLRSASMRYSKGSKDENIAAENEDMEIFAGLGIGGYPLVKGLKYYPRKWNGYIHYKTTNLSYLH